MSETTGELLRLNPAQVHVPADRLRAVDPDRVRELAVSIIEIGQMTPIDVRPVNAAGKYVLTAGAHRLAAIIENGGDVVLATEFDGTPDVLRLREIDENLFRAELTAYDQAAFLAERREIYERAAGRLKSGPRSKAGISDNLSSIQQMSFFDDVSAKFGLPKRLVQRAMKRRLSISQEVWHRLRGHPIGKNGAELDKLARLNEAQQRQVVRLLTQEAYPAKNVSAALRSMSNAPVESVDERQFRRLSEAWEKAGAKARKDFWLFLQREGHRVTEAGGEFPS